MKKRAEPKYFVPALEKGLDILEALSVAEVPQSLTALARTLDRTSSELFRMVAALERRSYIARDLVSDGYHLTLKMYELAHTHSPVDQLLKASAGPMRDLAETIHESCHLSVLSGPMLIVVAQAESPEPVRLSIEVGYRALPLKTASGRVLMSFLEAEKISRFLATDTTYKEMGRTDRTKLMAEIKRIREEGFLVAHSSRRTGLDISCIVGNPRIGVLAALGVPFLPGGFNHGKERQLVPVIQTFADQITAVLGLTTSHNPSINARDLCFIE